MNNKLIKQQNERSFSEQIRCFDDEHEDVVKVSGPYIHIAGIGNVLESEHNKEITKRMVQEYIDDDDFHAGENLSLTEFHEDWLDAHD